MSADSTEPTEPTESVESAGRTESTVGFTEVEGVDYVVDYYAVLGLERGADEVAVKAALRERRSQYHPDRLVKAAPELQETAAEKMDLFARAEQVLLGEAREHYDALLEGFDQDLVSTNGIAIVSIDRRRVAPDALLLGRTPDQSDMVPRAEAMLGFDESKLAELKALYEADPENPTVRKLCRDELNSLVAIRNIGESAAWSDAGVLNQDTSPGPMAGSVSQYVDSVRAAIATVRKDEFPEQLREHRRALNAGVGEQRLLTPGGPGTEVGAVDDDHLARITGAAQEAFDRRSQAVVEAAERTQEAIAELVELTESEYLAGAAGESPVEVVVVQGDKILTTMLASYDAEGRSMSIGPSGTEGTIGSVAELRDAEHLVAVILIERNPNVPSPLMEITFVLERHFGIRADVDTGSEGRSD